MNGSSSPEATTSSAATASGENIATGILSNPVTGNPISRAHGDPSALVRLLKAWDLVWLRRALASPDLRNAGDAATVVNRASTHSRDAATTRGSLAATSSAQHAACNKNQRTSGALIDPYASLRDDVCFPTYRTEVRACKLRCEQAPSTREAGPRLWHQGA